MKGITRSRLFLAVLFVSGCGGAGGTSSPLGFGEKFTARAPTPFVENGRAVTLEVVIYKPPGSGRFPAVLFHHGSTGNGADPSLSPARALSPERRCGSMARTIRSKSLGHSRGNFDAFIAARGLGTFRTFARGAGLNGHYIINDPALWQADLIAFIQQIPHVP